MPSASILHSMTFHHRHRHARGIIIGMFMLGMLFIIAMPSSDMHHQHVGAHHHRHAAVHHHRHHFGVVLDFIAMSLLTFMVHFMPLSVISHFMVAIIISMPIIGIIGMEVFIGICMAFAELRNRQ